jgi:hypothetical protein
MVAASFGLAGHANAADTEEASVYMSDSTYGYSAGRSYGYGTAGAVPQGQAQLAAAVDAGRGLNFVEVKNVTVVKILPDDTQGRKHQKWIFALDNGRQVMAVYNSDFSDERIPVQVGQKMSLGGQFIWDRGGGLLHWLHADPKNRRPDGYVEIGGVVYGQQ